MIKLKKDKTLTKRKIKKTKSETPTTIKIGVDFSGEKRKMMGGGE